MDVGYQYYTYILSYTLNYPTLYKIIVWFPVWNAFMIPVGQVCVLPCIIFYWLYRYIVYLQKRRGRKTNLCIAAWQISSDPNDQNDYPFNLKLLRFEGRLWIIFSLMDDGMQHYSHASQNLFSINARRKSDIVFITAMIFWIY